VYFKTYSFEYIFFLVIPSKRSELERVIKKTGSTLDNELYDNCVYIRGLPYGSTENDIVEFFQGILFYLIYVH